MSKAKANLGATLQTMLDFHVTVYMRSGAQFDGHVGETDSPNVLVIEHAGETRSYLYADDVIAFSTAPDADRIELAHE